MTFEHKLGTRFGFPDLKNPRTTIFQVWIDITAKMNSTSSDTIGSVTSQHHDRESELGLTVMPYISVTHLCQEIKLSLWGPHSRCKQTAVKMEDGI